MTRVGIAMVCMLTFTTVWIVAEGESAQSAPSKQQRRSIVLRGGLLIDGTGGTPLRNSVVLISEGKIQAVGTEGSVSIPADALVIDSSTKTIIPGLVDSHVHFRNFLAPFYLYWGITTIGDLGNPRGWILAYRDAVEKGRVAGPYIMASGGRFNAPLIPGRRPSSGDSAGFQTFLAGNTARTLVWDEASLESGVAEAKKLRLDAIKLFTRMNPALIKLSAQVAHRHGFPVFSHFTSDNMGSGLFLGADEIMDTGIDVYCHLYGLVKSTAPPEIRERIERGENFDAFHYLDPGKFPPLAEKMVEKKIFLNPTLVLHFAGGSKHWEAFDRLNTEFMNGPMAVVLPAAVRARYLPLYRAHHGETVEEQQEGLKKAGVFVKQFADRGGKIIAGVDSGDQRIAPTDPIKFAMISGLPFHMELQMLREVGLTPMQVIQAATSWSMEAWGKSNEVGTLEPGKRADILILNRNPLEDLMATTDIFKVIQGGTVVDREGLAEWKEILPKPAPQESHLNGLIQVPFINEISPEMIRMNRTNGLNLTITGENFSKDALVLLNDQLLPPKSVDDKQLRISIDPGLLTQPGVYPLAVVRPGSAGGVSNTFYLIVTPD